MKPIDEQLALIRRGVAQIEKEDELRKKLTRSFQTGKPLRVKYGIDPTGIDVHLGHTVPLRKLRLFQDLGHQAVLIIGNYTALVGDPSGRDQTRTRLTQKAVEANAKDYLVQVGKVIDLAKTEITRNGDWFGKMTFLDVMALCGKTTVQRMLERDDFTKRFKSEPSVPIYLHECLYPLMQGQDSVEIKADIELGGTEQLFNLMMGRKLQEEAGQEPQICLTTPILRGLDGVRRMGKSLGNYIGLNFEPYEMFAKTMSIPDELMAEWFELLTDRPISEIAKLADPAATHPRQAKEMLGKDIVRFYHGATAAEKAAEEFRSRISEGQDPAEIDEKVIPKSELTDGQIAAFKLLVLVGFSKSNNDARRLIQGGGVNIGPNREKISDPNALIAISDGLVVRSGKKHVVRVRVG